MEIAPPILVLISVEVHDRVAALGDLVGGCVSLRRILELNIVCGVAVRFPTDEGPFLNDVKVDVKSGFSVLEAIPRIQFQLRVLVNVLDTETPLLERDSWDFGGRSHTVCGV